MGAKLTVLSKEQSDYVPSAGDRVVQRQGSCLASFTMFHRLLRILCRPVGEEMAAPCDGRDSQVDIPINGPYKPDTYRY